MIKLLISEEYGYRDWFAELTEEEYQSLLARWETLRGVTCSVPVKLIIPQAVELDWEKDYPFHTHCCHLHECDDSHIDGSSYKIPKDINFWMNGRKYEESEYWPNII